VWPQETVRNPETTKGTWRLRPPCVAMVADSFECSALGVGLYKSLGFDRWRPNQPTPATPGARAGTLQSPIMGPLMSDQDRADFVSVSEAAQRLGTSVATVKRRIRAGTLEAEQLQRPQGYEYRVRVQRHVSEPSNERSDSDSAAPITSAHGTMQDVSAAIIAAVAPLVERRAVQDGLIAGQATALRELERENGRLTAAQTALMACAAERTLQQPQEPVLSASGATESLDPSGEPVPQPEPFPAPLPPTPNERQGLLGPGPLRAVVVVSALVIVLMLAWWLGH
jgi:hypothetical protein